MFVKGLATSVGKTAFHEAVFIAQTCASRPFLPVIDVVCIASQYAGNVAELVVGLHVGAVEFLMAIAAVMTIDVFGTNLQLMAFSQRS